MKEGNVEQTKSKKKQKKKTAGRDYDPYFGDMTQVSKPSPVKKEIYKPDIKVISGQLQELFPALEKDVINNTLKDVKGDFDLAFDALLKIGDSAPIPSTQPVLVAKKPQEEKKDEKIEPLERKIPEKERSLIEPNIDKIAINEEKEKKQTTIKENKIGEKATKQSAEPLSEEYKIMVDVSAYTAIAQNFIKKYPR